MLGFETAKHEFSTKRKERILFGNELVENFSEIQLNKMKNLDHKGIFSEKFIDIKKSIRKISRLMIFQLGNSSLTF